MNQFNFKSQPCTSREQSERLLALGLKKETADVTTHYEYGVATIIGMDYSYYVQLHTELGHTDKFFENIFPAWSLHRLIEMMPEEMYGGLLCIFKDSIRYEEVIMDRLEAHFDVVGDNMYENAISCIEWLIKEGYFPEEYLV